MSAWQVTPNFLRTLTKPHIISIVMSSVPDAVGGGGGGAATDALAVFYCLIIVSYGIY